jgi:hypothetical protein
MRFLPIFLTIAVAGCSPSAPISSSPATPTARPNDAVRALQAIDSATLTGTNMSRYAQLIAEAQTEVRIYLSQEPESDLAEPMQKLLEGHQITLAWWRCDLERETAAAIESLAQARCRDAVLPRIFAFSERIEATAQPLIEQKTAEWRQKGVSEINPSMALDKDAIVSRLWQETGLLMSGLYVQVDSN